MKKLNKRKRHIKIKEIISKHDIKTQDELVQYLWKEGFQVTQATVSRDIKELHLVKVPLANGEYKYSLPLDQTYTSLPKLQKLLTDAFVKIDYTSHLIVLKTIPGNAHAVGVLIDNLDWQEILGTICGDDTCLIIARTPEDAEMITKRFLELLS